MIFASSRLRVTLAIALLTIVPLLIIGISIFGPFQTDAAVIYSELPTKADAAIIEGQPTIDPNFGATSHALGTKAARDVLSGRLPLWNHFEGFGAPLLGEMQSAALFPLTWLMIFRHGQIIEQAVLQLLGGLGAYLFFRRFGLGLRASCAGAMVFEVNGVFAWLRNAIFNPVAFLPWLLYVVETAAALARGAEPFSRRGLNICVGAIMSALAVYSGFPEVLYLYCLFIGLWALCRLAGLPRRARLTFLADLAAIAILGSAISSPALIAFADYLPESTLGGHTSDGFYGVVLSPSTALQHILPYVYGPIFSPSANALVSEMWGRTGGYIGLSPVIIAIAALLTPGYRLAKLMLASWIVVCIGVIFGVPVLYDVFMRLPLTKIAACFRYITPGLIFCSIFLCALFIERVGRGQDTTNRIAGVAGIVGALVILAYAALRAWPTPLNAPTELAAYYFGSIVLGATIVCSILFALCLKGPPAANLITAVMVGEALVLFAFPYLSYPRGGDVDHQLTSFLQEKAGYSRVLSTPGFGIYANYGSYFGFSTINYNDLPAPARTADYIRRNLDPLAHPIIFIPQAVGITPEQQEKRALRLPAAFPAYAKVGVRYVIVGPDFGLDQAFKTGPVPAYPYPLVNGSHLDISISKPPINHPHVAVVTVLVGTYAGTSTGSMAATLCVRSDCARGSVDLTKVGDNTPAVFRLDHAVNVDSGYSIRFEKTDSAKAVGIWMLPVSPTEGVTVTGSPTAAVAGSAPRIAIGAPMQAPVYEDQLVKVIEIPNSRDYMTAGTCQLSFVSRDNVTANCPKPTKLVRLELFMKGWWATVNGVTRHVENAEDAFQAVELPAGRSRVAFFYRPKYFTASLWLAGAMSILLMMIATHCSLKIFASRQDGMHRRARF